MQLIWVAAALRPLRRLWLTDVFLTVKKKGGDSLLFFEESFMRISAKGFALIELVIVVAIIGVLATIAIPQFNEYRASANDAAARADVKNAIVSVSASRLE